MVSAASAAARPAAGARAATGNGNGQNTATAGKTAEGLRRPPGLGGALRVRRSRGSSREILRLQRPLRARARSRRPSSAQSEDVFRWWREQGNPSPLLLTEHELVTSTDCFAIEFHDIKTQHRLLYGKDVVTRARDRRFLLPGAGGARSAGQAAAAAAEGVGHALRRGPAAAAAGRFAFHVLRALPPRLEPAPARRRRWRSAT